MRPSTSLQPPFPLMRPSFAARTSAASIWSARAASSAASLLSEICAPGPSCRSSQSMACCARFRRPLVGSRISRATSPEFLDQISRFSVPTANRMQRGARLAGSHIRRPLRCVGFCAGCRLCQCSSSGTAPSLPFCFFPAHVRVRPSRCG
jgi:hypothetical protein